MSNGVDVDSGTVTYVHAGTTYTLEQLIVTSLHMCTLEQRILWNNYICTRWNNYITACTKIRVVSVHTLPSPCSLVQDGQTPVYLAVWKGRTDIVNALITAKADFRAQSTPYHPQSQLHAHKQRADLTLLGIFTSAIDYIIVRGMGSRA